jgi:hypothetical protein
MTYKHDLRNQIANHYPKVRCKLECGVLEFPQQNDKVGQKFETFCIKVQDILNQDKFT